MVSQAISTKEDVLRIYKECMEYLKNDFPAYYSIVKEYTFKFSNRKSAYGTCNYTKKVLSIGMYLSAHVENWKIKDTMLHEMAHAIDKGVNGYSSGHGNNWKRICREIGCDDTSTSSEGSDKIKRSKYVIVFVKSDGTYEYLAPAHKISRKNPLNTFRIGSAVRGRKETLNRIMTVTFEDFVEKYDEVDKK